MSEGSHGALIPEESPTCSAPLWRFEQPKELLVLPKSKHLAAQGNSNALDV